MSRASYLLLCLRTSLQKRWGWLLLTFLVGAVAGLIGLGSPAAGALAAVAALLLHAAWIAAGSYQRHSDGYVAPRLDAPEAGRRT